LMYDAMLENSTLPREFPTFKMYLKRSRSQLLCIRGSVSPSWRWAPTGLTTRFWLWLRQLLFLFVVGRSPCREDGSNIRSQALPVLAICTYADFNFL